MCKKKKTNNFNKQLFTLREGNSEVSLKRQQLFRPLKMSQ